MKGINIWFSEPFEKDTVRNQTERRQGNKKIWVRVRPIGLFSLRHRIKCALLVFNGKADIIQFYKQ